MKTKRTITIMAVLVALGILVITGRAVPLSN
jgi:hypothetical protein